MVRDDMIGYIVSGNKRLLRPGESEQYKMGEFFLVARGTQWDMINDTVPQGRYVAHVILLTPELIELFHDRFAQFTTITRLQSCAKITQDKPIEEVFGRTFEFLKNEHASKALNAYRYTQVPCA